MLVGLTVALLIHLAGIITRNLRRINTKDV
jgi:hypothetical protein